MQDTELLDLLSPWLVMIAILVPLIFAERWVHQHFFGIGYLISKDKLSATRLFYVFFLPGIFIHEAIQWLVAGALNVPIKQVVAWPDKQENGTLRLDFIVVNDKETDPLRASLVAAAPFLIMAVMVWYISTQILDLHTFTSSLGSGDIEIIWASFTELFRSSNFILWFYLLFVLANSMVPKRSEARGIPLLLGIMVIVVVVMVVIGLDAVLIETFGGPVAEALDLVNTALVTILVMDVIAIFLLGLTEDTLERFRGFKMDYSGGENITRAAGSKKRQPGSDEPIPKGKPLPSIYSMALPLPDPSERPRGGRPAAAAGAGLSVRDTSAREPSAERPSLGTPRPSVAGGDAGNSPPQREGSFGSRGLGEERPGSGRSPLRRGSEGEPARPAASQFGRGGDTERPSGERPGSGGSPLRRGSEGEPARPAASQFGRGADAERPAAEKPGSGRSPFRRASDEEPARSSSRFGRGADAERPAAEKPGSGRSPFRRGSDEEPARSSSRFGRGADAERPAAAKPGSGRSPFRRGSDDQAARPTGRFPSVKDEGDSSDKKPGSGRSAFRRGSDDQAARPTGRFSSVKDEDDSSGKKPGSGRSAFRRGSDDQAARPTGRFPSVKDEDERPARPTGRFGASESSGRPLERPARSSFGRPPREESDEEDADDVRYEPLDDIELDPDLDDFNQDMYEDE